MERSLYASESKLDYGGGRDLDEFVRERDRRWAAWRRTVVRTRFLSSSCRGDSLKERVLVLGYGTLAVNPALRPVPPLLLCALCLEDAMEVSRR